MVGSMVSDENVVMVCRSRICCGLKTPLLDHVIIGCPGAIGCAVGMGSGGALIRIRVG